MRKWGLWGGGAVLLLALGVAAASAAPPGDDDDLPKPALWQRDGWNPALTRLFGGDKKPAAGKDKAPDKDKKVEDPAPRPAPQADVAARYRALEEAKLHRRQDVCLRLREIARERQDEELERKAIQLDQLAWEVYQERTLRLSGGTADTDRLEKRQPTDASSAASRLNAPVSREDTTDPASTASVREVKP